MEKVGQSLQSHYSAVDPLPQQLSLTRVHHHKDIGLLQTISITKA